MKKRYPKIKKHIAKKKHHCKIALLAVILFAIFFFAYLVGNGTFREKVPLPPELDEGITPIEDFFAVQKGPVPQVNVEEWTLEVTGLVDNPQTFTYEDILAMESVTEIKRVMCVQDPVRLSAVGKWKGVRLKDLFDLVGVKPEAKEVVFYAVDDYSSSLELDDITDEFILAYEMNDQVLPVLHGYPLRLVAPNKWGYKWVKWINKIELVDYDHKGFWENRGWDDKADVPEKYRS